MSMLRENLPVSFSRRAETIVPFLVIFLAFALVTAQWLLLIRVRSLFFLSAFVLAGVVLKARPSLSARDKGLAAVIVAFAACLLAGRLLTPGADSQYGFAVQLSYALLGWAVVLAALQLQPSTWRTTAWLEP